MYQCEKCGGELRYNIDKKNMKCQSCSSLYSPYAVAKEEDAEESVGNNDEMLINVYRCPQCGAQILSEDQDVAGFCSYCASSVILEKKLERAKKPDYIVPFLYSKDYCKAMYFNRLNKDIYAPSDLKNPDGIEAVRGIYMPYWIYKFKQSGYLTLSATEKKDYISKEQNKNSGQYYTFNAALHAEYDGVAHDASSTYPDFISERLGTYDVYDNMKEFTPAYLCGFYADSADIGSINYQSYEAECCKELSANRIRDRISQTHNLISSNAEIRKQIKSETLETRMALFPVWFLSFRRHKRMAYVAMNGQSGRLLADIPISIRKYLLFSFLLTIPLFLLFYFMPIHSNTVMLLSVIAMTLVVQLVYNKELKWIMKRDLMIDDVGRKMRKNKTLVKVMDDSPDIESIAGMISGGKQNIGPSILYTFLMIIAAIAPNMWTLNLHVGTSSFLSKLMIGIYIITVVSSVLIFRKTIRLKKGNKRFGFILSTIGIFGCGNIVVKHTAEESQYVVGAFICIIAVIVLIVDLFLNYNMFVTQKIPQLDSRNKW